MAARGELMALGTPWQIAQMLGDSASPGPASNPPVAAVAAAGTTFATATPLAASVSVISTAAGQVGVVLPSASGQPIGGLFNAGPTVPLVVYPALNEFMNGVQNVTGTPISVTVPALKSLTLIPHMNQWIANVSA